MNITVLGAGAMGCLFGGRLAEAGHQVVLVDIRAEQVEDIHHDGLRIEDDEGERTVRLPARLANDEPGGPCELVLLLTKAHHSDAALVASSAIFGLDTWVLTLQNGLGVVGHIRERVHPGRIVVGTTTLPSDLVAPGRVRTHGTGATPDGRRLAEAVAEEVISVARRKGIAADLASVQATIAMAFREHGDHQPSMLQDVKAGAPPRSTTSMVRSPARRARWAWRSR